MTGRNASLYLLRDRIGKNPCTTDLSTAALYFASDIGSIAALDGFKNGINKDVLDIYFVHGYIPAPYSIYEDIRKLEPGCILTLRQPFAEPELRPIGL